jgi:hypothetical protein
LWKSGYLLNDTTQTNLNIQTEDGRQLIFDFKKNGLPLLRNNESQSHIINLTALNFINAPEGIIS